MKRRPWFLACLPPLALVMLYLGYSLDFPRLDQWEFVLFLDKAWTGQLTFHDFWAQHNEHRLIFPRLLMLVLARLSHWNIRWELAANLLLGTGVFGAYMACSPKGRWILPLVSLAAFSMAQWQNWFLGWQMQIFMSLLATLGVLLLLSPRTTREGHGGPRPTLPGPSWFRFILSMALATVATCSFANGMVAWPLGLLLLLLCEPAPRRPRMALAWCGVGGLVAAGYLYGYHPPDYHAAPLAFLHHPLTFALYVLVYLGQPVAGFSLPLAMGAGAIGLALWLWRTCRAPRANALYLALGLYTLMSALITAGGRVEFGVEQAMSSRYITLATPLWIALIATFPPGLPGYRERLQVFMLVAFFLATSIHGAYRWTERYHAMAPARAALLRGEDHPGYRFIYPPAPETILQRRPILVRHRLSIFAARE